MIRIMLRAGKELIACPIVDNPRIESLISQAKHANNFNIIFEDMEEFQFTPAGGKKSFTCYRKKKQ